MDERMKYVAIEISFPEDIDDEDEAYTELYDHLIGNGYHFYMSVEPGFEQIQILLIREDETGYIDTILEDRNIDYWYN